MSTDNIAKNKVEEVREELESEKLTKLVKLSERDMTATIILSILLPIGGYIYTRRWLPLLWFCCGGFLVSGLVSTSEPDEQFLIVSLYGAVVAPIDNGKAIARARERVKDLSL